jgi:hypothetical protein
LQASYLYFILYLSFSIFIYFAIKTTNNLLIFTISLAAISNVIGAPIIVLNKNSYEYSGWNAIMSFDFTNIYFAKIYSVEFLNLSLIILFTHLISYKLKNSFFLNKLIPNKKIRNNIPKSKNNKFKWDVLMFINLLFIIFIITFMYFNQIAIMGVEGDKLPFKLVGILFYTRGFILPIISFILYNKSSKSNFISITLIFVSLLIGLLSASRGLTFFYMFPVFIQLITGLKSPFKYFIVFFLILFAYMLTSISRSVLFNDTQLNFIDLLTQVFSSDSEFKSDSGLVKSLINIIGTISNRLYGVQDLILTYQYKLVEPIQSFTSFLLARPVINDPALELYNLQWLPGQAFGVGLGLMGVFILFFKVSFLLYLLAIIFSSFLISILNIILNKYFYDSNKNKYNPLYFLVLFFVAFNLVQCSFIFLYFIFIFLFILIHLSFFSLNNNKFVTY